MAAILSSVELVLHGGFDGTATFVTEHEKERRAQMSARVLEASLHLGRHHVSSNADDEEFAKVSIEDQFGWNTGVATSQDGGEGMLSFGEIGECLFANGRKVRFASNKTLIAGDQSLKCLIGLNIESLIGRGCQSCLRFIG